MPTTPIAKAETDQGHALTQEVCRGNKEAEYFCHLFYLYAHAIDDVIDTKEDGRPTMSNEKIIAIFANAALLYNSPFYLKHRDILFPMMLHVTNLYAQSVAWEKSPLPSRRTMADVHRCCGDDVFYMVALLCGGYEHMRALTGKIMETDYDLQHDAQGRPI